MANMGYLQVTRRCNQVCRFCSNPEREADVTLEEGKTRITELKEKGYLGVMFTGGEPTLSEHLPGLIAHCRDTGFMSKLCTNGQRLAEPGFLDSLVDAGLRHICMSLHSHRPDVQNFISGNPDSFANIEKALDAIAEHEDLALDILTTINKHNADHLSGIVEFILESAPPLTHLTWNHLDPRLNRASENPDTIPRLGDFRLELFRAMEIMGERGIPFQVERVPLCHMAENAHHSTETRRIVKREERLTYFLDERGALRWHEWAHDKAPFCGICTLNEICAGLYQMDIYYSSDELFPVFVDKDRIVNRILND